MKKKNFVTLLLGSVGGLLFSLGMCMCLLPEWELFKPGVFTACLGFVILLTLFIIRFKADGKHIKINAKVLLKTLYGIIGALVLGVGMCMIMVWDMMLWGIVVGIAGIVMLLFLVPMCVGFKKED